MQNAIAKVSGAIAAHPFVAVVVAAIVGHIL